MVRRKVYRVTRRPPVRVSRGYLSFVGFGEGTGEPEVFDKFDWTPDPPAWPDPVLSYFMPQHRRIEVL